MGPPHPRIEGPIPAHAGYVGPSQCPCISGVLNDDTLPVHLIAIGWTGKETMLVINEVREDNYGYDIIMSLISLEQRRHNDRHHCHHT